MATVIPGDFSEVRETQKVGKRKRGETKPRKNFPCRLCDKAFNSVEKLKVHSYSHTGERPYQCSQQDCSKAFVSKYKLQRHMATHSPEKTHRCSYCEKMFHRKDHLKNHLHTHDPHKETFKCEECGKHYNTKLGFKRHLALHAATSGDLTCKVCLQPFASTAVLLDHLKSHAGKSSGAVKEKKHQCEHCERRFYTRKDVRRHMVVHTGRKDFLCQYCAQRFGRKDHLTRHMKKSHGQELLRVKTEPVDAFLDPFACNVAVPIKDELLPVVSLPAKPFSNALQLNLYNGPFPAVPSPGSAPQMLATLPLGVPCPLDMDAVRPSHHLAFKYPFGSTSYALSIPDKEPALKGEVDGYVMELQGGLTPAAPAQDPQATSSAKPEPQVSPPEEGSAGDPALPKSALAIGDPLGTPALDFSQLFNFIPLNGPPYNPISVGSLGVGYSQEEGHSSVAQLPTQSQDLQDPAGALGLGSLHSLSAAFTSSLSTSTTLPRFHQAFQ